MEAQNRALVLWLPVILTGLMGGCSTGASSTVSRLPEPSSPAAPSDQVHLAQAAGNCWSTVSCCVQNHPVTPVESCGADPLEAERILEALGNLDAARKLATLKGVDVPERGEERDDGEERPDWREYCIEQYTRCQDLKWTGNCASCLERCKGQRGIWPEEMCSAPTTRRKR